MAVADDRFLARAHVGLISVGALLVDPRGRYLVQLRDDFPNLPLRDHWGLFGGQVEPGESTRDALLRELAEELDYVPQDVSLFTELMFRYPDKLVHHKTFFTVPLQPAHVERMTQHEGAAMELVAPEEIMRRPRVVPWDAFGIYLHARWDALLEYLPLHPDAYIGTASK